MSTNRTDTEPDDHAAALAAISHDYPGWYAWPGVLPLLLYARRPRTSPPMVVRAGDPDSLRQEIESAERERGLRR